KSNEERNDRSERIAKEKQILKSITLSYDTIKSIQKNLHSQLTKQNSLIVSSKDLLDKNRKLMSQQKRIYENVNRINNPLFPLDMSIVINVPFSSNKILSNYFYYLKDKITQDSTLSPYSGIDIKKDFLTQEVTHIIIDNIKYRDMLIPMMQDYLRFHFLIFRSNVKIRKTRISAKSGMLFSIGDSSYFRKRNVKFVLNFKKKECVVIIDFLDHRIKSPSSNVVLGFSDMFKATIFAPAEYPLFTIMALGIHPVQGAQESVYMLFDRRDIFTYGKLGRLQFHRISLKDFNSETLAIDQISKNTFW
ncbi:MAG TPA: hypothetical protein VK671_04605, partial [Mucilaginibacter sp.]|nr:hypothetical protein [Mucilaginibacter sp.]